MDCDTKSTAKLVKENLTNAEITKDEDGFGQESKKNWLAVGASKNVLSNSLSKFITA